jgi:MFS family permease
VGPAAVPVDFADAPADRHVTSSPTPRRLASTAGVLRAVLRSPALRRVMGAFLLFNAAEFGTWVAVLVYAHAATGPASVGIVALAQLLPAGAFAPLAATIADRHPRERVLLAGYLLCVLTFAVTGLGMLLGAAPPAVYAVAASAAAVLTLTRPSQGALLPALARTPEELTAANSLAGAVEGAGTLIGPLLGAVILALATPGIAWLAGGAACAVGALLVTALPMPAASRHRPGARHEGEAEPGTAEPIIAASAASKVAGGLRALAGNGDTRLIVALLGMRSLASGAIDVLFVLLALDILAIGEAGASLVTAALGLGTVLGGAASLSLVGRQRLAPPLALAALAFGAGIAGAALSGEALLTLALVAGAGVGFAAIDVTGRTVLQRVTPDRLLARVLGMLEGVGLLALALGAALVPVLVELAGIAGALAVVALLLPATIALLWLPLRRIDHHAHVPLRELGLLRLTPVFSPLPAPQLEAVARRSRWVVLEAGDALIREGEAGDRFYVLEFGSLDVTQRGEHLRVLDAPGSGIGEIALLWGVPRTATVVATAPCVLLSLDRPDFLEAVTGHDAAREAAEQVAVALEPTLGPRD